MSGFNGLETIIGADKRIVKLFTVNDTFRNAMGKQSFLALRAYSYLSLRKEPLSLYAIARATGVDRTALKGILAKLRFHGLVIPVGNKWEAQPQLPTMFKISEGFTCYNAIGLPSHLCPISVAQLAALSIIIANKSKRIPNTSIAKWLGISARTVKRARRHEHTYSADWFRLENAPTTKATKATKATKMDAIAQPKPKPTQAQPKLSLAGCVPGFDRFLDRCPTEEDREYFRECQRKLRKSKRFDKADATRFWGIVDTELKNVNGQNFLGLSLGLSGLIDEATEKKIPIAYLISETRRRFIGAELIEQQAQPAPTADELFTRWQHRKGKLTDHELRQFAERLVTLPSWGWQWGDMILNVSSALQFSQAFPVKCREELNTVIELFMKGK